ncbi:MAG: hypothetical protein EA396_07865 [Anaerolineaceae bacterium]|nr:MAG: hypothetical protein EA396_07865 [Anaerolineaceae bacterium]
MNFKAGDRIGAYDVVGRIGAGGMATVYKAHQPRLGRHVAIKVMHANIAGEAGFLARFEREAQIVASLDHPNIVPIYDYDDADGTPYLVMKYVSGATLKELLSDGLIPPAQIAQITGAMADALDYAHDKGILHRDVKPSNILMDERGRPYLTDFGLARIVHDGQSTMSADVMLGTPHYISPEQAQGNLDLDTRTDVYSLGIVLYEMCTGRTPFVGDTSYAIIHDQIYTPPPPARTLNPQLSPEIEAVLDKALSKERADRYESPGHLAEEFRRALGGEPINAPPPRRETASDATEPRAKNRAGKRRKRGSNDVSDTVYEVADGLREARTEIVLGWKEAKEEIRKAVTEARKQKGNWKEWFDDKEDSENLTTEERVRRRVKKRIDERSELFSHIGIFLAVNSFLWMIWFFTTAPGFPWPIFPMGGWGIGIVSHVMEYYNKYGGGRDRLEEEIARETERELQRMGYKRKNDDYFYDDDDGREVRLTKDGELTDSTAKRYFD